MRILRDRFLALLKDWGCTPIEVAVGKDEFDPEIHEAIHAKPEELCETVAENVIVQVRRRGWKLHGQVLVAPLVVVN